MQDEDPLMCTGHKLNKITDKYCHNDSKCEKEYRSIMCHAAIALGASHHSTTASTTASTAKMTDEAPENSDSGILSYIRSSEHQEYQKYEDLKATMITSTAVVIVSFIVLGATATTLAVIIYSKYPQLRKFMAMSSSAILVESNQGNDRVNLIGNIRNDEDAL